MGNKLPTLYVRNTDGTLTNQQTGETLAPNFETSFAFNFSNFVLIALLTGGRPDILGAQVPADTTDILVSYTYRITF